MKAVIAVAFISLSVYLYNDIIDSENDMLNDEKKGRPLPSGTVTAEFTRYVSMISGLIGLGITFTINLYCAFFSFVFFLLYFVYSYPLIHLKKRFIVKESVVTSGFLLTSVIGSYAVSGRFVPNALYAGFLNALLSFALQPAFNDTTDIEADRAQGVITLAMVLSWKSKMRLLVLVMLFVMTLTPLTYVQFGYSMILPIYVVAGSLIFLGYVTPIINKYDQVRASNARKLIVIYYTFLQIFAVVGSLQL